MIVACRLPAAGSSPLTRGKRAYSKNRPTLAGLIPAHAGKTSVSHGDDQIGRAHPRSRGENNVPSILRWWNEGSSPLTRGKRGFVRGHAGGRGLIPAHAGKTFNGRRTRSHAWAHPRSRGENRSGRVIRNPVAGSSPLTRGKPATTARESGNGGLIPAHAGKTPDRGGVRRPSRAHPRSRGENSSARIAPSAGGGSSPLTRGKHLWDASRAGRLGLIPAHAGKTDIPV